MVDRLKKGGDEMSNRTVVILLLLAGALITMTCFELIEVARVIMTPNVSELLKEGGG